MNRPKSNAEHSPTCMACEARPAKRLSCTRVKYHNARIDAVFCSRRCAADYGLLAAGWGLNDAGEQQHWCGVCKSWSLTSDIHDEPHCFECFNALTPVVLRKSRK